MHKFFTLIIALGAAGVLAGHNCKCQDPSGTGPQWDDLTEEACGKNLGNEGDNLFCGIDKYYHGDQHHQCTSPGGCLDSGAWNTWCLENGAAGAFCWD
ncbi:hypothetical protein BJX62DRAFT_243668 [Aspergillus germanicus]